MSRLNNMNGWEKEFKPGRDHIRRLTGQSKRARIRTNRELARDLYDIALELPDAKSIKLVEAAERLSAVALTENQNLGEN